jgi:replication-associated recombination protein RarA
MNPFNYFIKIKTMKKQTLINAYHIVKSLEIIETIKENKNISTYIIQGVQGTGKTSIINMLKKWKSEGLSELKQFALIDEGKDTIAFQERSIICMQGNDLTTSDRAVISISIANNQLHIINLITIK